MDWEKAFDRIAHNALFLSLERLNIPTKLINMIRALYRNPTFKVNIDGHFSNSYKQHTGIRQGCPLSPYLFVIFMTVLFHDVEKEVGKKVMDNCMDMVDFSNILYADDTFLVGKRSRELNRILWAIEKHSSRYGMKLNKGKCVAINMGGKNVIKFKNGETMKQVEEATYLGG